MPVLTHLRNPNLRPRHWDAIRSIMQSQRILENSITLREFLTMDVLGHTAAIAAQSEQATKEAAMEAAIVRIAEAWENTNFTLVSHNRFVNFYMNIITLAPPPQSSIA